MFKKLSITAAVFAVSGVCAFLFFGLTDKDIVAVNKFAYPTGAEPLAAGDVVVIPSSGTPSKLCDTIVAANAYDDVDTKDIYINRAQSYMGWFTSIAANFGFVSDDIAQLAADVGGLPFFGSRSSLLLEQPGVAISERCKCEMARSFSKGDLVCTVSASLIETNEVMTYQEGIATLRPVQRNLGVSLRRHPIYLPAEVFQSCGVEHSAEAKVAQQRLCDNHGLPTDVLVRDRLNLIDRRPFPNGVQLVNQSQ